MANSVQNRKQSQEYINQIQQEKAERKKELSERSQSEMKQMKKSYLKESQEIDREASAAVNHIKTKSHEESEEAKAEQKEKAATYSRNIVTLNASKPANRTSGASEASAKANSLQQQEPTSLDAKSVTVERPQALVQNYITKDTDAFYKVQDRGSRMAEVNNGYVIEAYVPEHEKDNLQLSVQEKRATISGKRKFQDSVEDEQKKMTTNNFQTFHEEFQFDRPVSTQGMTREREGDYIRFFIPKLESLRFEEDKLS